MLVYTLLPTCRENLGVGSPEFVVNAYFLSLAIMARMVLLRGLVLRPMMHVGNVGWVSRSLQASKQLMMRTAAHEPAARSASSACSLVVKYIYTWLHSVEVDSLCTRVMRARME